MHFKSLQKPVRSAQCKRILLATLVLLPVLAARPAAAHDFWIEPEKFRASVGDKIALRLLVGQEFKGNTALYNPEQFERYLYAGPGGEKPVIGVTGDDPAGTMSVSAPGLFVLGYHSKHFTVTFDTYEEFEKYLNTEGLERNRVLAQKRGVSRGGILEQYQRCAKSLVAGPRAEAASAAHVFGCPLELIAETNPYRQSELKLRLLYLGQPLDAALVVAFNKADPLAKLKARTDKDGRVSFKLPRKGIWLVTSVHMIPMPWYVRADWESFWASLTFELPALR